MSTRGFGPTSALASRPRQRGFALIEVLIAALVFGLGSLALLRWHASLVRHAEAAQSRSMATQLAQARLDELRSIVRWTPLNAPLPAEAGAMTAEGVQGADVRPNAPGGTFKREWQVNEAPALGLRRIDVRIGWTDRDGRADPHGVRASVFVVPQVLEHTVHASWRTEPTRESTLEPDRP